MEEVFALCVRVCAGSVCENPSFTLFIIRYYFLTIVFVSPIKAVNSDINEAEITNNTRVTLPHQAGFQLRAIFNPLYHFIFNVLTGTRSV